jgi:hypothetical protein
MLDLEYPRSLRLCAGIRRCALGSGATALGSVINFKLTHCQISQAREFKHLLSTI